MSKVNNKLSEKYSRQQDGALLEQEEIRIIDYARTYAFCEHSLVVMSNLRTNKSHVFVGRTGEILGIGKENDYQCINSCWEEEIFANIHPDDRTIRDLQEISFFNMMSTPNNISDSFPWYMETVMRMKTPDGKYRNMTHRIQYFPSEGKRGISYALCIYNFTTKKTSFARIVNKVTGEERKLAISSFRNLLTDREKEVLLLIRQGFASKEIADRICISKHTVDRHRQNVIEKLHVNNTTQACHKAKELGLIE